MYNKKHKQNLLCLHLFMAIMEVEEAQAIAKALETNNDLKVLYTRRKSPPKGHV